MMWVSSLQDSDGMGFMMGFCITLGMGPVIDLIGKRMERWNGWTKNVAEQMIPRIEENTPVRHWHKITGAFGWTLLAIYSGLKYGRMIEQLRHVYVAGNVDWPVDKDFSLIYRVFGE